MLDINNLDIIVNQKYLVENLSLTLNRNDKLAIIGEEGDGKSTLLKAMVGICDYATVTGSIQTKGNRVGYLPQMLEPIHEEKIVKDFLFSDELDYFNKINKFYYSLKELDIKEKIIEEKMKNLSGGEKIKVQILKLRLEEYDVLLLDEPTNDLDLNTLKWLENFILKSDIPIIYVSHDEKFLENTANRILHLEQIRKKTKSRYTLEKITYKEYIEKRLRKLKHQTQIAYSEKREYKKQEQKLTQIMSKVEHQQNVITRADPHGAKMLKRKMKSLKSQEKKLNDNELIELPDVEDQITLYFESVFVPPNKIILNLDSESIKINNHVLVENINLEVKGKDHIVIVGNNGIGKTTLLRLIVKKLQKREDIRVGYMPQNYDEIFNKNKTPIDFLCCEKSKEEIGKVRSYLGNLKFTQEEMVGEIPLLSGGSKAKLFLLKLVLDQVQVLVLDEPTRNISPLSNPIIRKSLKDFSGTIISVSHDRKYIEEVADRVYRLTKKGLEEITEITE